MHGSSCGDGRFWLYIRIDIALLLQKNRYCLHKSLNTSNTSQLCLTNVRSAEIGKKSSVFPTTGRRKVLSFAKI
jgi:hypothetical protein